MVDSGAAANFMDINLAHQFKVPKVSLKTPLSVTALDSHALGDGKVTLAAYLVRLQSGDNCEEISRHIIHSPEFPVVLGFPWLNRHNPHIDWITGHILECGPTCPHHLPLLKSLIYTS